jgi:predicted RNA-binding Zn-ribbon protein involved in translation (DUF1610 family)
LIGNFKIFDEMNDMSEEDQQKNWNLVEKAKADMAEKKWVEAKALFQESLKYCEQNKWDDGTRYANEMIEKCDEAIDALLEKEAEIIEAEEEEIENEDYAPIDVNSEGKVKIKVMSEEEAQAKAEKVARLQAEAKAKAFEEERLKAEQEAKAKAEEEAKLKAEQEAKAKAESAMKKAEENVKQAQLIQAKAASTPPAGDKAAALDSHEVLVQSGSSRLKCPKCGNVTRNMIREVQDPGHIIMDYPLMYGKKYICGKCGTHWRREEDK